MLIHINVWELLVVIVYLALELGICKSHSQFGHLLQDQAFII